LRRTFLPLPTGLQTGEPPWHPHSVARQGRAHQAILDAVESLGANVVVLGAQGEHEGVRPSEAVGDTALKVAEQSRVPALFVRRKAQEHYRFVVACAKGAPADRLIMGWANSMSPEDLIHIVSAYTVPYEGRLVEWGASKSTVDVYATRERDERTRQLSVLLSELGLPAARARLHLERGEPLQTILHNANNIKADLIIVGRRAQADSLAEGAFGSVARHVVFLAPVDVMIVPPT
jgi:nucleotide-binding universal stress UspA family protein